MKRFRVILAIGAVLVWGAVFPLGCPGNDGSPVDTNNAISVYVDKDVVTYGDTLTVFIENVWDVALKGGMLLRIAASAGETIWAPDLPLWLTSLEPGEKVSWEWVPVRYPPDEADEVDWWWVEELLPGDYYAEGGWWNEPDGPPGDPDATYIDSAKFTLVEEHAPD